MSLLNSSSASQSRGSFNRQLNLNNLLATNLQMPNTSVPTHLSSISPIPQINIDASSMNGSNFANQVAQYGLSAASPTKSMTDDGAMMFNRNDDDESDEGMEEWEERSDELLMLAPRS